METINHALLRSVLQKTAYVPPAPAAPPMPPMDPSMMGGAPPMPPMDPSMMGGAPPMPPMDPSMMGGMPPMDPSMMGGAPPPMDPSMVGGLPGEPAPEGGQQVTLSIEDLRAILAEATQSAAPEKKSSGRTTNTELAERIDGVEMMLASLLNAMGIPVPEQPPIAMEESAVEPVGAPGGAVSPVDMAENMPEVPPSVANAETAASGGMPAPMLGGELPGVPKEASYSNNRDALLETLRLMGRYS
jgi:hypothetical protein